MLIDSPPSHRAGRFIVGVLLVVLFGAALGALILADMDTWLIEYAKTYIAEVRGSWTS